MANATLLSLVQSSLQGLGVVAYGQPSSVVGNSNQDVMQTLALLNAACDDLGKEREWQAMTVEYRTTTKFLTTTGTWTTSNGVVTGIPSTSTLAAGTWSVAGVGIPQDCYIQSVDSATQITLNQTPTVAGTAATLSFGQTKYALPSDFDRQIDRTHYDKSKHWEMGGPETAQEWQWLKSAFISTGPRLRYRILGNYFQTFPMITSAEYIGFEYVSKNWCLASADVAPTKSAFTLDTDTVCFPDAVMRALIKLKYYEAKGFDTSSFQKQYNDLLSIAKAADAGSPMLSFAPRYNDVLITSANIPDSGYGQ